MDQDLLHNNPFAFHLADRNLATILSSAKLDTSGTLSSHLLKQSQALSSLTSTALTAHDASLRFNLGVPLRVMVETQPSGPNVLLSYLDPESANGHEGSDGSKKINETTRNGVTPLEPQRNIISSIHCDKSIGTDSSGDNIENRSYLKGVGIKDDTLPPPPLLVAMVVTSNSANSSRAKKAVTQLARAGREYQKAWIRDHIELATSQVSMELNDTH